MAKQLYQVQKIIEMNIVIVYTILYRRQSQKIEGGFHSTPGHKYTEIGNVVLDDGILILQALGQVGVQTTNNHSVLCSEVPLYCFVL